MASIGPNDDNDGAGFFLIDRVRDSGHRCEAERMLELYTSSTDASVKSLAQAAEFFGRVPHAYAPRPRISTRPNHKQHECGDSFEVAWRGGYPLLPRLADMVIVFHGGAGVEYHAHIDGASGADESAVQPFPPDRRKRDFGRDYRDGGDGMSVGAAVGAFGRFMANRPKSPRVDASVDRDTRLGRLLQKYGADSDSLGNLEGLELAVHDAYFAVRRASGELPIQVPKTDIDELAELGRRLRSEWDAAVHRVAAEWARGMLAELCPLAHTLYTTYPKYMRELDTVIPAGIFRECEAAAQSLH